VISPLVFSPNFAAASAGVPTKTSSNFLVSSRQTAIRASAGGRHVPGMITIRARRDGDAVELAVIDNGGGIDDDKLERIVEPFETTKAEGLGMGLPIVRAIAEQHDGALELENAPGRGLTASFRVPAWKEGRASP